MLSLISVPWALSNAGRHDEEEDGHQANPRQSQALHKKQKPKQKHDVHYEFMGPPGAASMLLFLPIVVFGLYIVTNPHSELDVNPFSPHFLTWRNTHGGGKATSPFDGHTLVSFARQYLLSAQAAAVYLGWFLLNVVLYFILPGRIVEGVPLDETGTRLKYPLNGLASMFVSSSIMIALAYFKIIPATIAYDQFPQLAFTACVFSFVLSISIYLYSLYTSRDNGRYLDAHTKLAPHGNTGNKLYDFFIGRSLNPRWFGWLNGGLGLDLKYFCELRPGLVGWALLNLSFAWAQYQKIGRVTNSMILVNLFQAWYVFDAQSSEIAILTTMDITTDGFGWMLVFGDLCWVPFTYCTQARFLVDHIVDLSWLHLLLILGVKAIGFIIFRGSNGQKNQFRTDRSHPSVRHLPFIQTERGTKLLTGGYWGLARHFNYFGDLLMGLSWCLPCGFSSPIPYFYSIYFTTLLVHRERRDEEKCSAKYGKDWKKYCDLVPWRIVPYVY